VEAVSEKSITQQQAGVVRWAKTSRRDRVTSLGVVLVANSLCRWQEKHTMCEPKVQIGNSGLLKPHVKAAFAARLHSSAT
jgi:hypothetical protein